MEITYRSVREWICPICGGNNLTPETDVIEDGVAVCWKCTAEFDQFKDEDEEK